MKKYLSMAIAGALLAGTTTGFAAVAEKGSVDEYALDDVVVTATRSEKKDVDVPAATVTITAQQIKESGAQNAADALSKVNGFTFKSSGGLGADMGTMSNEAIIRGVNSGTLVLVNGNPVSWRGKYNLQGIPAASIERIEIVKGNGSVLYGSDAMAGVINIITKTKAANQATIGYGNFGQQEYHINAGAEGFTVTYDLDKWLKGMELSRGAEALKNHKTVNSSVFVRDVENKDIGLSWHINDQFDVMYQHYNTQAEYDTYYNGDTQQKRLYETIRDLAQVNYHGKDWKGSFHFNTGTTEARGPVYLNSRTGKAAPSWYNTRERNTDYGLDLQKTFQFGGKTTFIVGTDWQHEVYQALPAVTTKYSASYSRNVWGMFGQWEQDFDKKNSFILGARETWTSGARDTNYSNFSASGQFLHKLNHNDNIYLSVNQSFVLPTFPQKYGTGASTIANPDLKPQTGTNYELGWKRLSGEHSWKAALFHTDIKNNIWSVV